MKTVKQLKIELDKFPDDALCYAYEGEVRGIIILKGANLHALHGVIHCEESTDPADEPETEEWEE